jgi:hypothetical protein
MLGYVYGYDPTGLGQNLVQIINLSDYDGTHTLFFSFGFG